MRHKLDWDRITAEAEAETNYPKGKELKVNDLGQDKDITISQQNLKNTEKKLNTKYTLSQEYDDFV